MDYEYPDDWNQRRRAVYRRDGYQCQNCGAKGGPGGGTELHAHHIVPKSSGGSHETSNLITVCKACHDAIHGDGTAPTAIEHGNLSERIQKAIERHYRTDEYDDGYVRLGKSDSPSQRRVDKARNDKYDGCPECGEYALTVSWLGLGPGKKVKVVECESCRSQYAETVVKEDGTTRRTLNEIDDPEQLDPARVGFFRELKNQIRLLFNI